MLLMMMRWEPVCHKAKWQRHCVLRNCSSALSLYSSPGISEGQLWGGRGRIGTVNSAHSAAHLGFTGKDNWRFFSIPGNSLQPLILNLCFVDLLEKPACALDFVTPVHFILYWTVGIQYICLRILREYREILQYVERQTCFFLWVGGDKGRSNLYLQYVS